MSVKRILVPVDFSERASAAFRAAVELASPVGAEILLLHMMPAASIARVAADAWLDRPLPHTPERDLAWAREELDRLISEVPHPGLEVRPRIDVGDPAAVTVRTAVEEECDLIVIGTRGRAGLLGLGGVARTLLSAAPCPVLAVRVPSRVRRQA